MLRGSQVALLLAGALILSDGLHAEAIREGVRGSCSLVVASVTENVAIVCNSSLLSEYDEIIRDFSQLVNGKKTDLKTIREYVSSHLELIDGNYVAPQIENTTQFWTARQTFYNPPFKSDSLVKPDFVIIDYMGPFSNVANRVTLIVLGPTNDPIYLENGDPSHFNKNVTESFLDNTIELDIEEIQRLDEYRLPPLDFFGTEVLIVAGRRGNIPKQYLSRMRERNADLFYSGSGLITYDSLLERLASRRL